MKTDAIPNAIKKQDRETRIVACKQKLPVDMLHGRISLNFLENSVPRSIFALGVGRKFIAKRHLFVTDQHQSEDLISHAC